jgi:hypothetical protein
MRFFKHIGLRAAWDMRGGGMLGLILSLLCDCRPVVDLRLLPFLASPRKCKQKKATQSFALVILDLPW